MTAVLSPRGTALPAVLALIMILLPVGAFVVLQCRTDLLIQHNLRAEIEAFYVAEAGLEHALSEISPGTSFDAVLAGPDRVAGTADDGIFPFTEGAPSAFPYAPFRYDVRVAQTSSDVLTVQSSGIGVHGATKVVIALVRRDPLPATPAAFHVDGDASTLDMGSAGFLLSGWDHQIGDPPDAPTNSGAALPALSSSSAEAEATLRRRLWGDSAQRLVGTGGPPSLATAPPVDVQRYATACSTRPERVQLTGASSDAAVLGTVQTPQLSFIAGDLDVSGELTGVGVLVIQGTWHVSGDFTFSGLVLAMGGIVLEPASRVTVTGGVWRAASNDGRLQLAGSGGIGYSRAALAAVDAAFAGLLPHAAVVASWEEQL